MAIKKNKIISDLEVLQNLALHFRWGYSKYMNNGSVTKLNFFRKEVWKTI